MWLSPLSSSVTEDDKLTKNVFTLFDQVREQLSIKLYLLHLLKSQSDLNVYATLHWNLI